MEEFELKILKKIDNNEKLTERELSELVWEFEVECNKEDNRRWSRSVETIVKIEERFFSICWEEGLTENQDNYFGNQPVEVKKETYEKTITVTKWIPLKK